MTGVCRLDNAAAAQFDQPYPGAVVVHKAPT
jgi:hypothetical protein